MKKIMVAGKKMILFIDTGDNCRCPLAKGYMGKLLDKKNIRYVEVRTAGVMTPTGLLPTPEVVQLLQEEGVDIRRHRSRPLSVELIRQADLILGMTSYHVQKAIRMTEEAKGKIFLLKEYVGTVGRNVQIVDPMGGTMEIFKKCFSEIKQCLTKLSEMEFIAEPPVGREMVVVDTTPKPKEVEPEPVLPPKRELPSMSAETERAIAQADAAHKKEARKPEKAVAPAATATPKAVAKKSKPEKSVKKTAKPEKPKASGKTKAEQKAAGKKGAITKPKAKTPAKAAAKKTLAKKPATTKKVALKSPSKPAASKVKPTAKTKAVVKAKAAKTVTKTSKPAAASASATKGTAKKSTVKKATPAKKKK